MVSIGEVYLEISASKKKELATTLLPTNFNREKGQFNRGKGFARVGEPDLALNHGSLLFQSFQYIITSLKQLSPFSEVLIAMC